VQRICTSPTVNLLAMSDSLASSARDGERANVPRGRREGTR
jgi:hypothetical protein